MTETDLTILITAGCSEDFAERIRRIAPAARILSRDDLKSDESLIGRIDIVYGRLKTSLFPKANRLKWVHTTAAGATWAQEPDVLRHPAVVTNCRIHAVQISEHLFGMLLMLTHRLHWAYARQLERVWDAPRMAEISALPARTLCVLGLGSIGRRCAALAAAHGMRVVGVKRNPCPVEGVQRVLGPDKLNEALRGAEVVMNLLPETSDTRRTIGAPQFAAMADGAIFLNAGRGSTVDTDALVAALRTGKLAAAGLDVVDPEPLPPDHPLWDMPNVIITAHYSGLIDTYFQQAQRLFLDNLRLFLEGKGLEGVVDKAAGY